MQSQDESIENDDVHSQGESVSLSSQSKPISKRKRSKYNILDEKWNTKLANLDSKLDNKLDTMFSMFKEELQKQRRTANGDNFSDSDTEHTSQRRVTKGQKQSQRHVESDHENGLSDDNISLQPGQTECNDLQIDIESDVEDHEGENLHVSDKTRKCLFELFGEDAVAEKTEKEVWY